MSADRWSICPKCEEKYLQKVDDARKIVLEKYGIVSADEYHDAIETARKYDEGAEDLAQTLREYFGFGVVDSDGTVSYRYHASCDACDFRVELDGTIS